MALAFPSISREEHFAQKLHAYTLPRTGRPNSRVKDLIDLVLLMEAGALKPERLRNAIRDTFSRRATHELPPVLEAPPDFWGPAFERLAEECRIHADMDAWFEELRQFLVVNLRD